MDNTKRKYDVLIIGAGPSGAVAGALLAKKGHNVLIMEKEQFPRFSIGESLLPQCMEFLEEAGMIDVVNKAGYQFKDGAAFQYRENYCTFDFSKKSTPGWGTTFQVQRADFDKLLADEAERKGVEIRYHHEITSVDFSGKNPLVFYRDAQGKEHKIEPGFVFDASGFGRVLPRLLGLDRPSHLAERHSLFTHIVDNIDDAGYDRDKILITIHPECRKVWYWLIPFGDGRASVGVVAEPSFIEQYAGDEAAQLKAIIADDKRLSELLVNAKFDHPVRKIKGYSADVSSLCGNGFALLGNAGEFLDPVFSSGVTIALKSSSLAASLLDRQLAGAQVDWQKQYAEPLMLGVDTFRVFVNAWYDECFQDVIFHQSELPDVKEMLCSILAGYAWDQNNPYVKESERRLSVLAEICKVT